jgi:hypothetical protein
VNFSKTSAPPEVQGSALASADLFFGSYSLDDGRFAMCNHILFNVGSGVSKTIANQFFQEPLSVQFWQVSSSAPSPTTLSNNSIKAAWLDYSHDT